MNKEMNNGKNIMKMIHFEFEFIQNLNNNIYYIIFKIINKNNCFMLLNY